MRLDKYLKVSRLIKRRTVANEACAQSRVLLNGKVAKPSAEVSAGDTLAILFSIRRLTVRVVSIQEHAPKADAPLMYEVLEDTHES